MSAGMFEPDSVTWRMHADPSMLIGGMRALLVQALHPLAMAGVEQHSDYRADPWGRLRNTVEYVMTVTYGTTEEAEKAGRVVQAIHKRVRGTDPVTGKTYSAEDPELLVWVHAVEAHSFLVAYRRYGAGRFTKEDADRYVAEQVRVATLVGLDPAIVPSSVAELHDYFQSVDDELRPSPYSRDAAKVVLNPPLPLPLAFAKPIAWIPGAAAAGLMPRRLRAMHGIPWVPPADAAVRVAATALTKAMGVLPDPPHVRAAKARWARAEAA
ncbi:MAG: DUF2236 domain-containing protein [Acidimicrobiia bacterium]|nr:DUF2236 domain-containing protein [Acidimicrobiia bacterium]MBV9041448.1 DUF2236 domain-containing protein [Acidimicrobiia bacterium]